MIRRKKEGKGKRDEGEKRKKRKKKGTKVWGGVERRAWKKGEPSPTKVGKNFSDNLL